MPYINLNIEENIPDKPYHYTIIGAGAAGILLAVKLTQKGYRVNIIESGHFQEDDKRQSLNEVVHKSKFLNTAVWGRKRAIGGTTIAWGGQSLPFSKIDFEERDWLENSGWPIKFEDLKDFYDEANEFMGIDKFGYTDLMLEKLGLNKNKPANEDFVYHVSKWSNKPNFAKTYHSFLEKKVDIYYNAHLVAIHKNKDKIESISVSNFKKKTYSFKIQNLIIAAGGIESVRIIQLSELSDSDFLGLGFMEHPCIEFGEITNYQPYKIQRIFNTHFYNAKKYSIRLSLSEGYQKTKKLLNASISIMFEYPDIKLNPYQHAKQLLKQGKISNIPTMIKYSTYLLSSLSSYLFHGFLFKPNSIPKLSMMLEQEATSDSKIYLSDIPDSFGLKKAEIDWTISNLSWKTFVEASKAVKKLIEENNLGAVTIYPHLNEDVSNANDYFSGVNHHMGGARMGYNKENSVVNSNLKLWDFENAYVCSASVFPTSSHSNPTLTLLALTCRLSKYLININHEN